jgi:hypothetical protein
MEMPTEIQRELENISNKYEINDFYCPITCELMEDPVIAADGHSYERTAFEAWIKKNVGREEVISPLGGPLKNLEYNKNWTLHKAITAYKEVLNNIKKKEEDLNKESMLRKKIEQECNKLIEMVKQSKANNSTQLTEFPLSNINKDVIINLRTTQLAFSKIITSLLKTKDHIQSHSTYIGIGASSLVTLIFLYYFLNNGNARSTLYGWIKDLIEYFMPKTVMYETLEEIKKTEVIKPSWLAKTFWGSKDKLAHTLVKIPITKFMPSPTLQGISKSVSNVITALVTPLSGVTTYYITKAGAKEIIFTFPSSYGSNLKDLEEAKGSVLKYLADKHKVPPGELLSFKSLNEIGALIVEIEQIDKALEKVICICNGYDLALISDKDKPKKGIFYVRLKDNALEFIVINPKEEIVKDKIEKEVLESILMLSELTILYAEPFDCKNLVPFLPKILKVTSKKGYTYPSYEPEEILELNKLLGELKFDDLVSFLEKRTESNSKGGSKSYSENNETNSDDKESLLKALESWTLKQTIELSHVGEKNKLSEDLHKQARNFGSRCHDVPGDGNCLFEAVAHQLEIRWLRSISQAKLRLLAVEHISQHQFEYQGFIEGDFDKFVERVARDGTWANNVVITALARALDLTIIIINSDGSMPIIENPGSSNIIYLGYEIERHYQSLLVENQNLFKSEVRNHINSGVFTQIYNEETQRTFVNSVGQQNSQAKFFKPSEINSQNKTSIPTQEEIQINYATDLSKEQFTNPKKEIEDKYELDVDNEFKL